MIKNYFRIIITLFILNSAVSQAKEVTIWNYYNVPPFTGKSQQGLVKDTVAFLNRELQGHYVLKLKSVPRSRVDRALHNGKQGAVLFVNWKWMGESAKSRYLWTKPLLNDQNVIVSSNQSKVEFSNIDSLKGLNFGAIIGRIYPKLESLFASGSLKRIDLNSAQDVLKVIAKGRLDATTQPLSQINALCHSLGIREKLYIAEQPLFSYQRHILVTSKLPELVTALNDIIANLPSNGKWHRLLEKHQVLSQAVL